MFQYSAPTERPPGTVVSIFGSGFGNDPDDLCVIVMNGNTSNPLEILSAHETEIRAVLGAVPPRAQPGPIVVGLGQGRRDVLRLEAADVLAQRPVWVWSRFEGPMAESQAVVESTSGRRVDYVPFPPHHQESKRSRCVAHLENVQSKRCGSFP